MKKFLAVFLFPVLVAACSKEANRGASAPLATNQPGHPAAGEVYDLTDILQMQDMLLKSKTKLEVSQAEFLRLRPILPDQLRVLTDGLVDPEEVATIGVRKTDALVDVTLVGDSYDVTTSGQPTLKFAHNFALTRILPSDGNYGFARVSLQGVSVDGKNADYLYILKNGDLQLGLAGAGDEIKVRIPSLTALFQAGDVNAALLPNNGKVAEGIFAAADIMRNSSVGDNVIQMKSSKLDASGQPILDANGNAVPDRDYRYRKLLRQQLAGAGLDAKVLQVMDNVTEITVDKNGIQVWLSEAVELDFASGSSGFAPYFRLESTGPTTLAAAEGITASSPDADGANVQEIRLNESGSGTSIDVDVYGYRNTLLGTFGQTQTVSFPL